MGPWPCSGKQSVIGCAGIRRDMMSCLHLLLAVHDYQGLDPGDLVWAKITDCSNQDKKGHDELLALVVSFLAYQGLDPGDLVWAKITGTCMAVSNHISANRVLTLPPASFVTAMDDPGSGVVFPALAPSTCSRICWATLKESGSGDKRMVNMAMELLMKPRLHILHESTIGFDSASTPQRLMTEDGLTGIASSHQPR